MQIVFHLLIPGNDISSIADLIKDLMGSASVRLG